MSHNINKLKVALICGGPSPERGISLNSARSVMDHLSGCNIEIVPFYVDTEKNFYKISNSNLYCNTPSDFDFKLSQISSKLEPQSLISQLKDCDISFPVIHGAFGEDGEIQEFFEKNDIAYIGCSSKACSKMFYKNKAAEILKKNNYNTITSKTLKASIGNLQKQINDFWEEHDIKRAVIKPTAGGSSIGVHSVKTKKEAEKYANLLLSENWGDEILIEEFCEGREFTVIIIENDKGEPVPLIPTEIRISYEDNAIFDYRRKYLPTNNTSWYCPPHFTNNQIDEIRKKAKELFILFEMQDFARIDGWILNNGNIVFTDFNPISGMEQNSFIFQQSTRVGITHSNILNMILSNACKRNNIALPKSINVEPIRKNKVNVLFGGKTAERQVSVMSGTNIWLKLRKSEKYIPEPFLLDQSGAVWRLPYTYALNHTVEEIYENCLTAGATIERLKSYAKIIRHDLFLDTRIIDDYKIPEKITFEQFMELSKKQNAFVFLGLHGGEGEDGTIQTKLEANNLYYNGSDSKASELCMDKYITGQAVNKMGEEKIFSCPKRKVSTAELTSITPEKMKDFWGNLTKSMKTETFVIKPVNDGCSAGIIRLNSMNDMRTYINLLKEKATYIPKETFENQNEIIEMSANSNSDFIIESFIKTDRISIKNDEFIYNKNTGWLEFTIGVLEQNGKYHSLSPSITVAEGEILSLEEKFQGGTGINVTPPPENIISKEIVDDLKLAIEKTAKALTIKNYARIDAFFNLNTHEVIIIEANTLPALTPSTVIYHQALAEEIPMNPTQLLETIIELKTGCISLDNENLSYTKIA